MIETLPIEKLVPNPDNPRDLLGDVSELAASIASVGVLQTLLVSPNDDGTYTVVCGNRRLAAATEAGLAEVPAIVRELDDVGRAEAALSENLQREDLDPLDEATALARLRDAANYSQRDLAKRLGCGQSHVSKRLQLLELPKPAQQALREGDIGIGDALELAKLADDPKRVTAVFTDRKRHPYLSVTDAVARQVRDRDAHKKQNARAAELEATGVKVLKRDWFPSFTSKERMLGKGHRQVDVDPKEHAGLACHAVVVDQAGDVAMVCTKPANHPDTATAKADANAKAADARRQRELERREVAAASRAKARTDALALTARGAKNAVLNGAGQLFLIRQLLNAYRSGELGCADEDLCRLLEVPYDEHGPTKNTETALTEVATSQPARFLMAIALSIGEEQIRWNVAEPDAPYLQALVDVGYQPTTEEAKVLGLAPARKRPAPARKQAGSAKSARARKATRSR